VVVAAVQWSVPCAAATAWAATEVGWVDWPAVGMWLAQHGATLAWAALTVLLAAWATWRAVPRPVAALLRWWNGRNEGDNPDLSPGRPRPRPVPMVARPPFSWWMVAAALAVVAAVAVVATALLLHVASAAKDPAAAQVDAIKTGLSIAVGTGGVFALLLAARRQWHQELTAGSTEADAAARRITEQYTKASDQLGSDRAPVRLAGLHALERLAQDNQDQRPTIVELLCSYLRMPYSPPEIDLDPDVGAERRKEQSDLVQEREVRVTAQRILGEHLHPGPDPDNPDMTFWSDISLDLSGAVLVDFSMTNCRLHTAMFMGARFVGHAGFGGAQFSGHAWFEGVRFAGHAWFKNARFAGVANFDHAEFDGRTSFAEAQFTGYGDYTGLAGFRGARFAGEAWFRGAGFAGDAEFGEATFNGRTVFSGARFAGDALFDEARFVEDAVFEGTRFAGKARFSCVEFARYAGFHRTHFAANAVFNRTKFADEAVFAGAVFAGHHWSGEDVGFTETEFFQGVAFDREITNGKEGCWARVGGSMVWPRGWTIQPTEGHGPPDQDDGPWGHLVCTPDPGVGAGERP
jgi:uncharacterized protein YjbI with pentapeptide repeats